MIKRHIESQLTRLAAHFPVVTILGPRQSGKTTLACEVFKDHAYVNLEQATPRHLAEQDPEGFFERHPGPLIIDEVQRVPALLSTLQVLADRQQENGRFILTGSHQPALHAGISQSLAGRTGILRLMPLSIAELSDAGIELERDEYILRGFMPSVHAKNKPSDLFYRNYYLTYVERDVRQLVNVNNQLLFETFVKMLAGRVGQLVNLSGMAGDIGVSSTTLASWLSVLEASYIVFRLPCYFNNFGKRLVKAPKIYFTDVGLAAWLIGIETAAQVARDPIFGGLFENMVVAEAFKARYNAGKEAELYYFRDHSGLEVDLILNDQRQLRPFEIKAAQTFNTSLSTNLARFRLLSKNVFQPTVIYAGDSISTSKGITYAHFKNTAKIINNANPLQ